jgi:hypothetical protein
VHSRKPSQRCLSAFAPLALAVILGAAGRPVAAERQPDVKRVLLRTGADTVAVVRALGGAQRKLQAAQCAGLLAEFNDHEGRALEDNLAPFEVAPPDYLVQLIIKDGGGDRTGGRLCRSGAAAVTVPGSRVVYICGGSFRDQAAGLRENTLIHEMLHTLGLRENPPTSAQINARVRQRCGS